MYNGYVGVIWRYMSREVNHPSLESSTQGIHSTLMMFAAKTAILTSSYVVPGLTESRRAFHFPFSLPPDSILGGDIPVIPT